MHFLQDFLFNDVNDGIYHFLQHYDRQNNTHYSVTANLQNVRMKAIEGCVRCFLRKTNVELAVKDEVTIQGKVNLLLDLFIAHLFEEKRDKKFMQVLRHISECAPAHGILVLWKISDQFWKFLEVYDEDNSFYSRRGALCATVTMKILQNLDGVMYVPVFS